MITALWICAIGGLVYLIASLYERTDRPVPWSMSAELGRLAFFAGLLACLLK